MARAGLEANYPGALERSVAVLTPYKAQTGLLKAKLSDALGERRCGRIEIATVDGFQVPSHPFHTRLLIFVMQL